MATAEIESLPGSKAGSARLMSAGAGSIPAGVEPGSSVGDEALRTVAAGTSALVVAVRGTGAALTVGLGATAAGTRGVVGAATGTTGGADTGSMVGVAA
ncbi:MAG: hypothetical protein ACREX8_11475, partial [Gammaproteobacteria bacterium]